MTKTQEQAKIDLLSILSHLRLATADARTNAGPEGKVGLAIVAFQPDGSGQIFARLEAPDFVEDLGLVLGAAPETEDEVLDAKARQLLDKLGI